VPWILLPNGQSDRCLGAYTNPAGGYAPWILLLNAAVDRAGMDRQIGALEPTTHRTGGYAPWILLLNAAVDRCLHPITQQAGRSGADPTTQRASR
jgi:hypothetical protein